MIKFLPGTLRSVGFQIEVAPNYTKIGATVVIPPKSAGKPIKPMGFFLSIKKKGYFDPGGCADPRAYWTQKGYTLSGYIINPF